MFPSLLLKTVVEYYKAFGRQVVGRPGKRSYLLPPPPRNINYLTCLEILKQKANVKEKCQSYHLPRRKVYLMYFKVHKLDTEMTQVK